jgi:hypothetical protein
MDIPIHTKKNQLFKLHFTSLYLPYPKKHLYCIEWVKIIIFPPIICLLNEDKVRSKVLSELRYGGLILYTWNELGQEQHLSSFKNVIVKAGELYRYRIHVRFTDSVHFQSVNRDNKVQLLCFMALSYINNVNVIETKKGVKHKCSGG